MKTDSTLKRECSSILHQASRTTNCINPVLHGQAEIRVCSGKEPSKGWWNQDGPGVFVEQNLVTGKLISREKEEWWLEWLITDLYRKSIKVVAGEMGGSKKKEEKKKNCSESFDGLCCCCCSSFSFFFFYLNQDINIFIQLDSIEKRRRRRSDYIFECFWHNAYRTRRKRRVTVAGRIEFEMYILLVPNLKWHFNYYFSYLN